MRLRLTRQAGNDVEAVLEQTLLEFGPRQVERYAGTISKALEMIAERPDRPSARFRPEVGPNVQAFHLALAAGRQSAASHLVYCMKRRSGQEDEVVVLRLLHERMEPLRHLLRTLQE